MFEEINKFVKINMPKLRDNFLFDYIQCLLASLLEEQYSDDAVIQMFLEQLLKDFEKFGEGEELYCCYIFYLKHKDEYDHSEIEIFTYRNMIEITKYSYIRDNDDRNRYMDWVCEMYLDGNIDLTVDENEFIHDLDTFFSEDLTLKIDSPFLFMFDEEDDETELDSMKLKWEE